MKVLQDAKNRSYSILNYANQAPILATFEKQETKYESVPFTFKNSQDYKGESIKDYKPSKYNIIRLQYNGDAVIFNSVTNACVVLNYEEYNDFLRFDSDYYATEQFVTLEKLGFFVPNTWNELGMVDYENNILVYSEQKTKIFTFIITEQCNARCFYCFEENEKKMSMSDDVLEDIISFMLKNINDGDKIVLDFFGGEPLMAERNIDTIIARLKAFASDNSYSIEWKTCFTSNGILADNHMVKKMKTIWQTEWIQITIDGLEEEHNKRKNLYNSRINAYKTTMANIENLLDNGIAVSVRLNFDKINIHQIDGILKSLVPFQRYGDENFDVFYALLKDINKNSPNYYKVDEYGKIHKYITGKLIEYGFYTVDYLLPRRQRRTCQACNSNSIVFDCDGGLYKCAQIYDDKNNIIGDCKRGMYFNDAFFNWTSCHKLLNECESCKFYPVCLGGCKYHYYKKTGCSPCVKYKHVFNDFLDLYYELNMGYMTDAGRKTLNDHLYKDPKMSHELAIQAIDGIITISPGEIVSLLKYCEECGYAPAINSLGIIAGLEEYCEFKLEEPEFYFSKASEMGYIISTYNLARVNLENGKIIDDEEKKSLFHKLSSMGIDKASLYE